MTFATRRPHALTQVLTQASAQLLAMCTAVLIGAFAAGAHAQPADADPPGRVARLSDINGQVWLYNPDSGEWVSAARNRPLTTGDRLATAANSC